MGKKALMVVSFGTSVPQARRAIEQVEAQLRAAFPDHDFYRAFTSGMVARKIERELGWRPAETFATGIRKTVEWYLSNPDWAERVQSGAYRDWVSQQYGGEAPKA